MQMRLLLIVGSLALAGCATVSGPRSIEWNPIDAHPSDTPEPVVEEGKLVLSGRAVRSQTAYAAPVTIECEAQPVDASTNSCLYIDLVPENQPTTQLPNDYLGIKLVHGETLQIWATRGGEPTYLIKPASVRADADGRYKLMVQARLDGIIVQVNNETVRVDYPVPYGKFTIELRTFPPPNPWRVDSFSVH